MSKHRDEALYLNDILDSINAIKHYLEAVSYAGFVNDRKTYAATIRELEIIGEAAGKLPGDLKKGIRMFSGMK